jgi:hypothetical protein
MQFLTWNKLNNTLGALKVLQSLLINKTIPKYIALYCKIYTNMYIKLYTKTIFTVPY